MHTLVLCSGAYTNTIFHFVCVLDILRKFDDMIEVILPQLPTSFDSITNPEGRAALIWILGEYGEVWNAPHLLCAYTLFLHLLFSVLNVYVWLFLYPTHVVSVTFSIVVWITYQ